MSVEPLDFVVESFATVLVGDGVSSTLRCVPLSEIR